MKSITPRIVFFCLMMAAVMVCGICYADEPTPLETLTIKSTELSQYGHILLEFTDFPSSISDNITEDLFTISVSFKTSFPLVPDTHVLPSSYIFSIGEANILSHVTFSDDYKEVRISSTQIETRFIKDATIKLTAVLHILDSIPTDNAILSGFLFTIDETQYIWPEQHLFQIAQNNLGVVQLPLFNEAEDNTTVNISFPIINNTISSLSAISIALRSTWSSVEPVFEVKNAEIQCKITNGSDEYPVNIAYDTETPGIVKFVVPDERTITLEQNTAAALICPSAAIVMKSVDIGYINSPFSTITALDNENNVLSVVGYSFSQQVIHTPIITTGSINVNSDLMISITSVPNNLFQLVSLEDTMNISFVLDNMTINADSIQCIGNSKVITKGTYHNSIISCDIPIEHLAMARDDPYEILIIAKEAVFKHDGTITINNVNFKTKAGIYGHSHPTEVMYTPYIINKDVDFAINKHNQEFYINLSFNRENIPLNIIDLTLHSNSAIPVEQQAHWVNNNANKPLVCSFGTFKNIQTTIIDNDRSLRLELPADVAYKTNETIHISCHHNAKAIYVNSQKDISTMLIISAYSKKDGDEAYTLEGTISQWQSNAKDYVDDNDDDDDENDKKRNIGYILLAIFVVILVVTGIVVAVKVIGKKRRHNHGETVPLYRSVP